jgi:hypothetical protein
MTLMFTFDNKTTIINTDDSTNGIKTNIISLFEGGNIGFNSKNGCIISSSKDGLIVIQPSSKLNKKE